MKTKLIKAYKHYSFGNRKENIILCQLRNKASNLNAHLFKDFLINDSRCTNCGSESEGNMHFFSSVQDTLNKEFNFLINLMTLVYLFILTIFFMVALTFHTT